MIQPRGGGKGTWRVGNLGDARSVERAVDMENPSRRQRREVAPEDSPASSVSDKEIVLWFAYLTWRNSGGRGMHMLSSESTYFLGWLPE